MEYRQAWKMTAVLLTERKDGLMHHGEISDAGCLWNH